MTATAPDTNPAVRVDDRTDGPPGGRGVRRWPLQPLLDAARLTATGLAAELDIAGHSITQAALRGLSDVQADRWAIRLGFHPVLVWGWDWVQAATTTVHPRVLIADDLRRRIDEGELRPGDTLPPVNELAKQWRVTTRAVTDATDELRREGLVTNPGRGRRPIVISPGHAEPRACGECGQPITAGSEHFPHDPGCARAVVGWCDCDHPTHPGCCPTCPGQQP